MRVKELKNFLEEYGADSKFYEFSEPTLSVEDSSEQLDVDKARIIKSLVFVNEEGDPVLAIVDGENRVSEKKLSEVHGSDVRMANPEEVEKFSGYKVGAVPPVGHGLKVIIDEKIIQFDSVIAGGGSIRTLVRLNPKDIVKITDAELANIT